MPRNHYLIRVVRATVRMRAPCSDFAVPEAVLVAARSDVPQVERTRNAHGPQRRAVKARTSGQEATREEHARNDTRITSVR